MNAAHAALALSGLTLGLVTFVAVRTPIAPPGDTGALDARLAAIEKRVAGIDDLRADLRALSDKLDKRTAAQERRAAPSVSMPTAAPAMPSSKSGDGAAPVVDDAALAEKVAERIEQRMSAKADKTANREYSEDGRWKAPIDELAAEVAMDDATKEAAKKVFDSAKDRGYALLKVQRLDGGSLLDDFCAQLKNNPDYEGATRELFRRIVSEHVPGTDQTYLGGFMEIGVDTDKDLAGKLDAKAMRKLRALRVDLLDVKTGYDPIGDYVRARLQ